MISFFNEEEIVLKRARAREQPHFDERFNAYSFRNIVSFKKREYHNDDARKQRQKALYSHKNNSLENRRSRVVMTQRGPKERKKKEELSDD